MLVNYRVHFLTGELQGRFFEFAGEKLSIGRSPNNDIVVSAGDISRQHLVILLNNGVPTLKYLSSHDGTYGDKALKMGDMLPLAAEVPISLGQNTVFQVEAYNGEGKAAVNLSTEDSETEGATVLDNVETSAVPFAGAPSCNDVTRESVLPALDGSATQAGNGEVSDGTEINRTRLATPEEILHIHKMEKRHLVLRNVCVILCFLVLLCGIVAYYRLFIYDSPNAPISFPCDLKKKVLADWSLLAENAEECSLYDYFYVIYPKLPVTEVKRTGSKLMVTSFVGRKANIPYRVFFEYSYAEENLHSDRRESFKNWMDQKVKTEKWRFDTPDVCFPLGKENGIPSCRVTYYRKDGNEYWFGLAIYLRYEGYVITCLQELPEAEQWRGVNFFARNLAIRVVDDQVVSASGDYWEGKVTGKEVDCVTNVMEARRLLKRDSPSEWGNVEDLLRTALPNIDRKKDAELYQNAMELLREMRRQQSRWYNAQRISYFRAKNEGNSKKMTEIRKMCAAIFTNEEDRRFSEVLRKNWSF